MKQDGLQKVLDRVAGLQKMLKDTQDKSASLEAQADTAKKQLVGQTDRQILATPTPNPVNPPD